MVRHLGQLLTVTILGGACLGMPTTMVSERERGVWRRFRLTPISTSSLVASAILARYLILITAGLLQIVLAMGIGMPLPRHSLSLCLAFTLVAFAFLGLGLVIAAIADNVPSVQALGQCIFLPMLIIGGVAVPLASLPGWAVTLSSFFPGRYAVQSLQACIDGVGTGSSRFDLFALFLIGASGLIAGAKMFRWDTQQRFATLGRSKWLVVVIATWAAVGVAAQIEARRPDLAAQTAVPGRSALPVVTPATSVPPSASDDALSAIAPPENTPASPPEESPPRSTAWQQVTVEEIVSNVDFRKLPPDSGVVSPIAPPGVNPSADVLDQINTIIETLPNWPPGNVADPVQRVRNLMYVAAVPDVLESEDIESFVPLIVFDRLKQDIPKQDLIRILYWVAIHPSEGDDTAANQLQALGLGNPPPDSDVVRERVTFYSLKLLGRLIGKISPG